MRTLETTDVALSKELVCIKSENDTLLFAKHARKSTFFEAYRDLIIGNKCNDRLRANRSIVLNEVSGKHFCVVLGTFINSYFWLHPCESDENTSKAD